MTPTVVVSNYEVLSDKYWKRPKIMKERGAPSIDLIYIAVGRALSQWERCEQELATLFLTVCECDGGSSSPVRRAFGAIESGAVRRNAIDQAAEVHFGLHWNIPLVRTSFLAVTKAASDASRRRDDIAHGIAREAATGSLSEDVVTSESYGYFLVPTYYNSARTSPSFRLNQGQALFQPQIMLADYRYNGDDIDGYTAKFEKLERTISEWARLTRKNHVKQIPFVAAVTGA